ncbi:MAG: SpoVR family protein [Myxococcota bacterium]
MVEEYFRRSRRALPMELEEARVRIQAIAKRHGLDFFETIFEMCDYDEINMIAAYTGFPTRYPHWRFGMEYLQMQKGYEYGLQKIYEMVINTDPAYAYLLDNNALVDQKLVMAHVFGHVDFFKNNAWFQHTNRKMLDEMANHAARVRRIVDRVGESDTERWIDQCLSLENLIDPFLHHIRRVHPADHDEPVTPTQHKLPAKSYMDSYINPPEFMEKQARKAEEAARRARRFPESPVRDVLGFVLEFGRMERWQADILSIVRDEAYYFAPQAMTKIMNEGWASFWHTKLMTEEILEDSEVVDYADHHSGTVAMRPGQLNPYKVGIELFRDIERRWDRGQFGKEWLECDDAVARRDWYRPTNQGKDKIFEVRRTHNDVTFIDTFLTEDFCRRIGLFTYEFDRKSGEYLIDSREFADVKQKLLFMISNHGQPRVYVGDANHANRGELELVHEYEGVDVQLEWAGQVLGNLARVWGRPVHLRTRIENKDAVLHHDGDHLSYEGPKPGSGGVRR